MNTETTPQNSGRRRFLTRLSLGLSGLVGAIVAIPAIGFLLGPVLKKTAKTWRAVGDANGFEIGKTVEVTFEDATPEPWAGVSARTAAWLRRDGEREFTAFSVNCSHLGCPVRWLEDAQIFMCPCHGGVYYQDGTVAAGPPPKPLFQYPVRIRGGQVEILASPIPIAGE
jgi:menaquinol-cytochrome c reductase iron-sulfur subunit